MQERHHLSEKNTGVPTATWWRHVDDSRLTFWLVTKDRGPSPFLLPSKSY